MGSVYNPAFAANLPANSAEDDEIAGTDGTGINPQLSAVPGIGARSQDILANRLKRQQLASANTAQMWQNYRDQLTQERVGPTKLERIASALTAFGAAPTRDGNFFQALNAANKNMLETGAEAAAAARLRRKTLNELGFKQAQDLAAREEAAASGNEDFELEALKAEATASGKDVVVVGDNLVDRKTGKVVYTGAAKALPPSTDRFTAEALAAFNAGTASPFQKKLALAYLTGKARPLSVGVPTTGLPAGYVSE